MTLGPSTALANSLLNTLRNVSYAEAATYLQLHTGDPGAAGTTAVSSTTTRQQVTWNAPSSASMSMSNTPTWSAWAGTDGEVVTHLSIWTASSSGTFLCSVALTNSKTLNTGDNFVLSSGSLYYTPAA